MRKRRYKRNKRPAGSGHSDSGIISANPDVAHITIADEWIKARNASQRDWIKIMRDNDVAVGIGPAGTGKTFIAVACALQALKMGEVSRIVITRPIVESGEKLGYLPGSLEEKINPYLRPIQDACDVMLGPDQAELYLKTKVIEMAPLAYMRGRTLENSYIILDEAQNATFDQMEMLLTRMGSGSKTIITGDVTQIDLKKKDSGLVTLEQIIRNIDRVGFVYFTEEDVVRHPVVKEIVKAYEAWKGKK